MSIFLERFVIAVCVALFGVALLNPLGFDAVQRVSLGVAAIAIAVFAARTVERRTFEKPLEESRQGQATTISESNSPASKSDKVSSERASTGDTAPSDPAATRQQRSSARLPASDTEPPRLAGFAVPSGSVDARNGPAQLEFLAHLVDDLSGVAGTGYSSSPTQARFRSPSRKQFIDAVFSSPQLVEGTPQNGRYRAVASVPQYSEAGVWHLEYFLLVDQTGNMTTLREDAIAALGFPTTFTLLD